MFQTTFAQAKPDFKLGMAEYSGDAGKIDDFVKANHADVQVLRGEARLTDSQITRLNESGKFVVAVGDQLMKIPVREIGSESDTASMNQSYRSGMLVGIAYLAVSESKRNEFVDALDAMGRKDHNVQRASGIQFIEMGRVSDQEVIRNVGLDDSAYQTKIATQAQGNYGSARVLKELLAEGSDVFDRVAPNLGTGHHIWEKYTDECREDLQKLIANYAK